MASSVTVMQIMSCTLVADFMFLPFSTLLAITVISPLNTLNSFLVLPHNYNIYICIQ